MVVESTRTADEASPFSNVRCTRCGGSRLKRDDGTPGVCSYLPCKAPLYDVDVEEGRIQGDDEWERRRHREPATASGLRQAWCSRSGCDAGAKVGADCPPELLTCIACGAPLTFVDPNAETPAVGVPRVR